MTSNISEKISVNSTVQLPILALPAMRTMYAVQQGIEKNILIKTWGGIGDQICAEPTIRFAIKQFSDCKVSLASFQPDLFRHLKFESVYDLKKVQPIWEKYFPFDTILPSTHIQWQFMSHMLINCVDFPSLCAFRCQIPTADREITLRPSITDFEIARNALGANISSALVAIHAGKHWPSKTFPKEWWDAVIAEVKRLGAVPVLVGADAGDERSTVDVDPKECIDLRNRLSITQSVALLQTVPVLLTNDSSPLHMAASGEAWIGYIATCKHPDYISHWRRGQWNWREVNHGLGGIWNEISYCPNHVNDLSAEFVPEAMLASWLPNPLDFAAWGVDKAKTTGE